MVNINESQLHNSKSRDWKINYNKSLVPTPWNRSNLLLLAGKVPNSPTHVLQPRIPLLRTPGRCRLPKSQNKKRNSRISSIPSPSPSPTPHPSLPFSTIRINKKAAHPKPWLIKIGFIESSYDLLHEVFRGAEPPPLSQQQRGLGGIDWRPCIQNSF